MAYSQVGIVNLALIRGKSVTISAMTENSVAARTASAVWDYIRDEVLSEFPWNFAKTRAELTKDSTAPTYGYDYRYSKPASCLKILAVETDSKEPVDYVEEGDYILTDQDDTEQMYMNYVTIVADYAKWPALFINAFAFRLAAELGAKLESIDVNDMLNKYQIALNRMKGHNQAQGYIADDPEGSDAWAKAGRT